MREPVQVIMKPSLDLVSQEVTREEPVPVSRVGDSPFQFMQLLDVLENQNNNLSNGLHDDGSAERNEKSIFIWDGVNAFPSTFSFKEAIQCLKISETPRTGNENISQSLTAREAVYPLNQASTDRNSESDKYLLGWPFLPQHKMQLIKCEKCSREFCSSINYKRHIRGHRRYQNMEKDTLANRKLLEAYWDKLSLEEARGIMTLSKASIENVTGPSLIIALASAFGKPGFSLMPHTYVKAGSTLLDIVGDKLSATLSSQELFSVLDDASEKTLSGCDALSLQKYIFGGNAGKIAFELRNLVACVSFMLEQELVKAWLIYKDTEVQRCQQLLVEEEEAAQRRQADLLERKRSKKQRQKDKKVKDSANKIEANIMTSSCKEVEVASREGTSNQLLQLDDCLNPSEASLNHDSRFLEKTILGENDADLSISSHYCTEDAVESIDQREQLHGRQVPRTADCFPDQVLAETIRIELASEDTNSISKVKLNSEEPFDGKNIAHKVNRDTIKKHELMIGSIIIKLEDGCELNQDNLSMRLKSSRESPIDSDISLNNKNQSLSNSSEPQSHGNSDSPIFFENKEKGVSKSLIHEKSTNETPEKESKLVFGTVDYNDKFLDSV